MDGPTLRALVRNGYAIAADNLGDPYDWYRSPDTNTPIKQINRIGVVTAAFSEDGFKFQKSPSYNKPSWAALIDADGDVQHGDYFVSRSTGTIFFLSSDGLPFELVAVQCNYLFDVKRAGFTSTPGLGSYGGDDPGNETIVMTGWPGRIGPKSRGMIGDVRLPSDPKSPWEEALLPFCGVRIEFADILVGVPLQTIADIQVGVPLLTPTDMMKPMRYIVSSNELTQLGWRILCEEAVP